MISSADFTGVPFSELALDTLSEPGRGPLAG
jgi:hypothetical protein